MEQAHTLIFFDFSLLDFFKRPGFDFFTTYKLKFKNKRNTKKGPRSSRKNISRMELTNGKSFLSNVAPSSATLESDKCAEESLA